MPPTMEPRMADLPGELAAQLLAQQSANGAGDDQPTAKLDEAVYTGASEGDEGPERVEAQAGRGAAEGASRAEAQHPETSQPQAAEATPQPAANPVAAPSASAVLATVEDYFPGLGPAVDCALAVTATLLLHDNANPTAVIYVGGPSTSKTTVADMFADHPLTYLSDNFTPAAFVSHAANVSRKELDKVDLLPRIKHKVLVTPELAPIFRGKEDELTQRFATITRVLDGRGLMTDSGTHGRRGHRGDYLFAWLGCTTPFGRKVWDVMGQLGSRLLFFRMDPEEEVTVEALLNVTDELPYGERLRRCREAIQPFVTNLIKTSGGVRGVTWNFVDDPRPVREWIARLAKVLVAMRSEPSGEADSGDDNHGGYVEAKRELPWRAHAVLFNLARGHALVHWRRQLAEDDLPLVAKIAVDSMPSGFGRVFAALVRKAELLTVADVKAALGVTAEETARAVMEELDRRGVMEYVRAPKGKTGYLHFRPEWAWFATPEFQAILGGFCQQPRALAPDLLPSGGCEAPPPATPNLVERRWGEGERGGEMERAAPHTAGNLAGGAPRGVEQ